MPTKSNSGRTESHHGDMSDVQKMEVKGLLVDFKTARAQIEDYQEMQHNLLWVNTSAAGAIVTAAIALNNTIPIAQLLLAIPIISGFLGILWVSLGIKTVIVSNYIHNIISTRLRIICQNNDFMGMERYFRDKAGMLADNKIINIITIPAMTAGATFLVFCLVGLVISGINVLPSCEWPLKTLWSFSCVLTILLTVYGIYLGIIFRK